MPMIELINGKKYVAMAMGRTFVKGKPQEVTDEEAKFLLSITGKVGPTLAKLLTKPLFAIAKKKKDTSSTNGGGAAEGQPARRRGRPPGKKVVARTGGVSDRAAAKKALEESVVLEKVDEPGGPGDSSPEAIM